MSWLGVWTRAVIVPAWRRAVAVWVGTGIVAAVIFGPTAMQPRDLTQLAQRVPAVGAMLAVTWLLLFVPTARVILRAEGASYLHALPGPRWSPRAIAAGALVALQLPWLALWLFGEGARGAAIVVGWTGAIAAIAMIRPRPPRTGWPRWRRPRAALRGVYARALRRRAGDALVRGAGLAVLAGIAAGLLVRNNALEGPGAAVLGAAAIAVVLVPGWAGLLLPLVEAHRASGWLAASLGMPASARVTVMASVIGALYAAGAAIAVLAIALAFSLPWATLAWIAAVALALSAAASMLATRAVIAAARSAVPASRVVTGAVIASAIGVVCVAWLGVTGVLASGAIGAAALLTVRA